MPYEYTDYSPIDCSVQPDLSKLKDKSVIVTGGLQIILVEETPY